MTDGGNHPEHWPSRWPLNVALLAGLLAATTIAADARQGTGAQFIIELCDGLAHAHRAGIVHRDVKPANVIVDDEDQSIKVVDFGIARVTAVTTTMTKAA